MRTKKLIEKLEDLATFLTLAANDAKKQASDAGNRGDMTECTLRESEAEAYEKTFKKVDGIIKEAKE